MRELGILSRSAHLLNHNLLPVRCMSFQPLFLATSQDIWPTQLRYPILQGGNFIDSDGMIKIKKCNANLIHQKINNPHVSLQKLATPTITEASASIWNKVCSTNIYKEFIIMYFIGRIWSSHLDTHIAHKTFENMYMTHNYYHLCICIKYIPPDFNN